MRRGPAPGLFALLCLSILGGPQSVAAQSVTSESASRAQSDPGFSFGRLVLSPDGEFFIFEWGRPYGWSPSPAGLARADAERPQTLLFKVMTPGGSARPRSTATELFPPNAGATYYLGALSPDNRWLSFYELDRDDNTVRAGAVAIVDEVNPKIIWFDRAPAYGLLDRIPSWRSATTLHYPTAAGELEVDISDGRTRPCPECSSSVGQNGERTETQVSRCPVGRAQADAVSLNGALKVSVECANGWLRLKYTKGASSTLVYEYQFVRDSRIPSLVESRPHA